MNGSKCELLGNVNAAFRLFPAVPQLPPFFAFLPPRLTSLCQPDVADGDRFCVHVGRTSALLVAFYM